MTSRRQDIATLNRASAHTIRFPIDFKTGADDVKVFIDGKKLISDTTWEDYYRDPEPAGGDRQQDAVPRGRHRSSRHHR